MSETVQLKKIDRHFQRGQMAVQALKGIDLAIRPGEFVALIGPSGSGKSTLMNLLGGLDRPTAGELWLNGVALQDASEVELTHHRRERVGFIFQSFNLLPRLTAVENVALPLMLAGVPKAEREQAAASLLQQVGLGQRLDHFPGEMSGGEQQRTAVARALINNPSLILADEPTGNLDSKTGDEVMALLQSLNREQAITLVVVTHDDAVAAYADRIVKLHDGEIVAIQEKTVAKTAVPSAQNSAQGSVHPAKRLTLADMAQAAYRNLGRRPVRNLLTAAGVLIGIVTLVAMVSFGVGVQREVQRNFETVGLESIFVRPHLSDDVGDGFDPFAAPDVIQPITPDLAAQIRGLPLVQQVTPALSLPRGVALELVYGGHSQSVRVSDSIGEQRFNLLDSNETLAGQKLAEGRHTSGVVLIAALADTLLMPEESYADLVGQQVLLTAQLPRGELGEFRTTIIGVRAGPGSRTIDLGLAQREAIKAWWFGEPDILQIEGYDLLIVEAVDLSSATAVIAQIEELNLETQSLEAILEVANQVLALLQALLGSVGGLALLVAALGVANTMMMAIYERTREIGVLKAVGASPREIRAMFTVEAGLIGLIGGIFGLLFGILLGRLVDYIAHRFLISEGVTGVGDLSVVPLWLALGALLFATFIGIVAGQYPAARAARLDPVTALRHE